MQSDPPREASQSDLIDPARARALQATLGMVPDIEAGMPLPPFFHYIYFWEIEVPAKLGRDGHPRVGEGLIPDMGLPRRMWAGGTLDFHAPLIAGVPAVQTVRVLKAERKEGRTGPLAFVTVEYAVQQDGAAICTEVRDIVYREDAEADPARGPHRRGRGLRGRFRFHHVVPVFGAHLQRSSHPLRRRVCRPRRRL